MKRTHFKKIAYDKLNARQKEQFNFQKIAGQTGRLRLQLHQVER
jgi:hypothetical protein